MKLRSGLLGLTLTSVVAFASANAADMYRAPAVGGYKDGPAYATVNWSGWYAGVNGGGAWSQDGDQFAIPGSFGGLNPSGGFGGGQIGYNWQGVWHPHLVLGVEADIQGAGISDKDNFGDKSELDWFGTVRGRVGYAFDTSLVYFTGGFAYGGVKNNVIALVPFQKDVTATGYVLGGGYEYKFSPAWSIKAEYQYINLGKNEPEFDGFKLSTAFPGVFKIEDDAYHTVRVGLNYHFVPGYEPLK